MKEYFESHYQSEVETILCHILKGNPSIPKSNGIEFYLIFMAENFIKNCLQYLTLPFTSTKYSHPLCHRVGVRPNSK